MATVSPMRSNSAQMDAQMADTVNGMLGPNLERSPRFSNLGFLKSLTERKTTRGDHVELGPPEKRLLMYASLADGQAPKRRGPKPDSKPALTRRQELNRQAQRTHRERKEVYMRTLEEELVRTKVAFNRALQEKNVILDENKELKEILQSHGIPYPSMTRHHSAGRSAHSSQENTQSLFNADSRKGSLAIGNATNVTSTYAGSLASASGTRVDASGLSPVVTPSSSTSTNLPTMSDVRRQRTRSEISRTSHTVHHHAGMNHDEIGVDFVLSLERVCHDHTMMMCVRSDNSETEVSGHAMMISCPPPDHVRDHPDVVYPHKAPDELPAADLMKLYDLSQKLPLGGEITPVQALQLIRGHERYGELTIEDFEVLKENLKEKSRCYGFGAVLEEFEVHDALSNVFSTKFSEFNFE